MKKIIPILLMICISQMQAFSQSSSKVKSFTISNKAVVSVRPSPADINPEMENRVLPKPHSGVDRATIERIKQELEVFRSDKISTQGNQKLMNADPPFMFRNFNGNSFSGFVPNDNDMAISAYDQVCSVTNSNMWNIDQLNNINFGSYSLHAITNSLGLTQEEFDPKILYDPVSHRFIVVCLNGFTDSTSNVLVGFSSDSTAYNSWNFYALPGDPLNNNLWTDFPMIAVSGDELFITVNLLYNDSTWQAGFNQSIIWQINKNEGYSGTSLNPLLHYDIHHNNEPIRNLCPVKGGSTLYGPNMYFLSNRNFTVENDTVFLVEVAGVINNPPPAVTVSPLTTSQSYRMPIDASQPFPDKLIVNDARILGAFIENNLIQFVSNMLDTTTGKVGIYHGKIDISGPPLLNASLYVVDTLYLAYPNIAYAGTGSTDNTAIISVLFSSATIWPGVAAFKSDGTGLYSPLTVIRNGTSYTNMLVGNERWGDYTGCQTQFANPGTVWVSGSYTITNHTTRTWIGELSVTTGTGLQDPAKDPTEMVLFPNPTEDKITISFENKMNGTVVVDLYSSDGKLVRNLYRGSILAGKNMFSFTAAAFPAGNYLLTITDGKGNLLNSKKIVRK